MKNQYFGDVNDYRKYGLLRLLSMGGGHKFGICWALTPNDTGPDGNKTTFLNDCHEKVWRQFDPDLYDLLRRKVHGHETEPKSRDIVHVNSSVISGAHFWNEIITDNETARRKYFENMWMSFEKAKVDVIFFDPDNGLANNNNPQNPIRKGQRSSCKYLFRDEVCGTLKKGFSVLFYQHFDRTGRAAFVRRLECEFANLSPCKRAYSFWTPHVVFLLIPAENHLKKIEQGVTNVRASPWCAPRSCRTSRCNDCRQILVGGCSATVNGEPTQPLMSEITKFPNFEHFNANGRRAGIG